MITVKTFLKSELRTTKNSKFGGEKTKHKNSVNFFESRNKKQIIRIYSN